MIRSRLLKNLIYNRGLLTVIDQGVVSFGSFITILFLGRYLSVYEFGLFSLAITTSFSLYSIANSLISIPMLAKYRTMPDIHKITYLKGNFAIQIFISIGSVILVLFLLVIFKKNIFLSYGWECFVFCIYIFCFNTYQFFRIVLLCMFRVGNLLVCDSVVLMMKISGLVLLLLINNFTLFPTLVVISFSVVAGVVVGNLFLRFSPIVNVIDFRRVLRENFRYGKWVLGESALYFGSIQIYIYVLAYFVNVSAVAAFNACQTVLNATNFMMNAMGNFIMPMASEIFVRSGLSRMSIYVWKVSCIFFAALLGYYLFLIIYSVDVLNFLYHGRYDAFSYLLPFMVFQYAVDFFTRPFVIIFRSAQMPSLGVILKTFSFLLTILCCYPLIKYFSLMGAVLGNIITVSTWLLVSIFLYVKVKNKGLRFKS